MKLKKLVALSLLTSLALIMFIIELRLPNLCPVAGVKLGLANIITVYCVYHFSACETGLLVLSRVILGTLFSGNMYSLMYSTAGAFACLFGMILIKKIIPEKYIWLCSIIGAVLHNTGQIFVAVAVTRTFSVISYYPILIFTGSLAGFFTGLCAKILISRADLNYFIR